MSTFSRCTIETSSASEMKSAGHSLALSLYRESLTILLTGDLGAGKTTFAQGFAEGLGIIDRVQSPTYALEQRYDDRFTHIDLYRLDKAKAVGFLEHSSEAHGIRMIEWADRLEEIDIGPHIDIRIDETSTGRRISCDFHDEPVPSKTEIEGWYEEVCLGSNIRNHIKKVAEVSGILGEKLMNERHWLLRPEALHAAALAHDLLRFVDFKQMNDTQYYTPSDAEIDVWQKLKQQYGQPHEVAVQHFLCERGYRSIGDIVVSHRGISTKNNPAPKTIEQLILAYADKRVVFDTAVTLDERFDDFIVRYGNNGTEDEEAKVWRSTMKSIEKILFPHGEPRL